MAAWLGRGDDVATLREGLSDAPRGRAVSGLSLFAEAIAFVIDGDVDRASPPYRAAVALWEEAGSPESLAIFQAAVAKCAGSESNLGREAGAAACAWFSSVGATLYLDLFQEAFPSEAAGAAEAAS